MKWLEKKEAELLQKWQSNQISLIEFVRGLVALGYSPDQAWEKAQK